MIFGMFLREFTNIKINHSSNERYFDRQRYGYRPAWPAVEFPKIVRFGQGVVLDIKYEYDEMAMGVKVLSDMIKNFTLLKRSGKISVYTDESDIIGLLKKVVKPPKTPEELARDAPLRRDNNRLALPKQIKIIF
jgi:hypothetical protein